MSPHITIHFEFGFTIGGKTPKKVRVGNAQRDQDQPPPVPRKDTVKRRSGHTYPHVHRSRAQQHVQPQTQYMQLPMSRSQPNLPLPQQHSSRPHVTLSIPNANAIARNNHHQQQHAHRSRRHCDPQHPSRQHDSRAARGRSAPPDAYHVSNWISTATVRQVEPVPPLPRRQTPLDEIPVMRFRLGDPDMPWTPRPEFGEDEGNESDDEFFATRRASAIYTNRAGLPETELRLISRHSAPMVLTADSLLTDTEREPPSRHLTALQDAMMTVDGGFGFSDEASTHQNEEQPTETSPALDLADVPSTTLSQDVATSLAMWNQDHRIIMGTARERSIAHTNSQNSQRVRESQQSAHTPAVGGDWSPSRSVGWAFGDEDHEPIRDNATIGLVSPVSSNGGFPLGQLEVGRRNSAPTVSVA